MTTKIRRRQTVTKDLNRVAKTMKDEEFCRLARLACKALLKINGKQTVNK